MFVIDARDQGSLVWGVFSLSAGHIVTSVGPANKTKSRIKFRQSRKGRIYVSGQYFCVCVFIACLRFAHVCSAFDGIG
jgi:hypothetical protein